ncbi:MAG: RRXRR domain-containing protein, partial [Fervidobacterium sp.]
SAVTEKEELICGKVKLRNDISELLKERRMYRRIRRNRLRYRKPRFDNRISSKKEG